MATVVSLTEDKIRELMAGWEDIGLSQDEINALVAQLWTDQATVTAQMDDFIHNVFPGVEANSTAAHALAQTLNDTVIPDIQARHDAMDLDIENIKSVDLVNLREDLDNNITNTAEAPHVYVRDEAPEDPDEDGRFLVVGDVWFDSNDNNRQRIWNGVEWSTFAIDIPDLSLTVKKFNTSTHMIY